MLIQVDKNGIIFKIAQRIFFSLLKFRFSEKATKFEKIFVVLLTRASCSVRTCQKVDEDF